MSAKEFIFCNNVVVKLAVLLKNKLLDFTKE